MKPRLILLVISIIGLFPGLIIIIASLMSYVSSFFEKQPNGIIGGSRLPTCLFIAGFNVPIKTSLFPLLIMALGIILYIGAFIWMTKSVR